MNDSTNDNFLDKDYPFGGTSAQRRGRAWFKFYADVIDSIFMAIIAAQTGADASLHE